MGDLLIVFLIAGVALGGLLVGGVVLVGLYAAAASAGQRVHELRQPQWRRERDRRR